MTILEAVGTGRRFKRPKHVFWLMIDDGFIVDENKKSYCLDADDVVAEDWIVEKKWYEGDFKEKYPNGVLCWVWDKKRENAKIEIVYDYWGTVQYPFRTGYDNFKHAIPLKKDEAPAIIGDEI